MYPPNPGFLGNSKHTSLFCNDVSSVGHRQTTIMVYTNRNGMCRNECEVKIEDTLILHSCKAITDMTVQVLLRKSHLYSFCNLRHN